MNKEKTIGRPQKQIDWKLVENCLQAHCSGKEIAAFLGIHPHTLYNAVEREYGIPFSDFSDERKAKGKSLLRLTQFQEAVVKKDRGMLIWLGKQLLGQRDQKDSRLEHQGAPTITIANFGDNPNPEPYKNDKPESVG